ncbi:thiamine pyrophosphate enzyme, N-terminal TPP binding domain-containing protein [Aspergillus avenaceus]|uniref:Acetolactate synthase n=1 Tax=Aspergillus avenaceus TaxID=36643 RepID=A0A5N6U560_ASPAV|nr:thiamine pyrophosphate enzyme, N-terminal TPP binding domain-containing protein [Aspergillus avenaceus]
MDYEVLLGLKGGDIVRELLAAHHVEHVFGYPGAAALPIFDAIYKTEHFQFTLAHHEQGAGHMAEGYAKASGKPGVVIVTSGPGSSNLATPMLDALLDGTPMIALCAQVPTYAQGTNAFQEIDIMSLSKPCTKWSTAVQNVRDLPGALDSAFKVAVGGRPGPVLLSLPKDVTAAIFDRSSLDESLQYSPHVCKILSQLRLEPVVGLYKAVDRVAHLVNISKKPVICAGRGIWTATRGPLHLKRLAKKVKAPVTTTLLGLGCYDEEDMDALHMVGSHGAAYANLAIQNADLVIVLGARLDERVVCEKNGFARNAQQAATQSRGGIMHFDIAADNIGKVVQVTEAVCGDLSATLPMLLERVNDREDRLDWLQQIRKWKKMYPFHSPSNSSSITLQTPDVAEELHRQTRSLNQKCVITTGVGQHQMWVARHYRWSLARSMVTTGGLGTMGFGVPSAIGAKLACPDAMVIDFDGDASFCMTMEELLTASQFNIDIRLIIINNQRQRMIADYQIAHYHGRVCQAEQSNPDFLALAKSMGCEGRRCCSRGELGNCIEWLLQTKGPVLLEICTDDDFPMLPIVPNGEPLDHIIIRDG